MPACFALATSGKAQRQLTAKSNIAEELLVMQKLKHPCFTCQPN